MSKIFQGKQLLCVNYLDIYEFCEQDSGKHPGETQMIYLISEVAKQERSPSLCGPVQAVTRADECEEELSRLAPSEWELS